MHEIASIYSERRDRLVSNIIGDLEVLATKIHDTLNSLKLPAALEKPLTLPSTLLPDIEEVRQKLPEYFTHIAKLKSSVEAIFSKAKEKLHAGQTKDKRLRRLRGTGWLVTEVEELNEYESDIEGYFRGAVPCDLHAKRKYDECEDKLKTLTSLEAEATKLRTSLNNVTSFESQLRRIVEKIWEKVEKDDINNAILVETARLELDFPGTQVAPASFKDFLKQRLARYNPDVEGVRTEALKQDQLIKQLEAANVAIDAAKDTSLRELQLQFENIHFKYKEIERYLVRGRKFYNGLAEIVVRFRDVCDKYNDKVSRQSP